MRLAAILGLLLWAGADDGVAAAGPRPGEFLAALRAESPEVVALESIGRSEEGRELWVAVVARGERVHERPGVLLVDYDRAGDGRATADALEIARELLAAAKADVQIDRLLYDFVFYVAPAVDPDRATGGAGGSPSAFECDFPAGWRAFAGGSGPYPLHRRETRALAAFLDGHPNIATALVLRSPAGPGRTGELPPSGGAAAPGAGAAGDLGVRFPLLAPRPAEGRREGDLVTWLEQGLGLPALAFATPSEAAGEDGDGAALRARAAHLVASVAAGLPRLTVREEAREALGEGMWLIDVVVSNVGQLSTGRPSVRRQAGGDDVRVSVSGVDVSASALRRPDSDAFAPLHWGGREMRLGHLGPGESRVLRLVVDGPEGGAVGIDVDATRAVSDFLRVELR